MASLHAIRLGLAFVTNQVIPVCSGRKERPGSLSTSSVPTGRNPKQIPHMRPAWLLRLFDLADRGRRGQRRLS